jgi:uncharacterized protein (TIGR02266 family)
MADDSGSQAPASVVTRAALSTEQMRAFVDRAPRCKVRIAVPCQQVDHPRGVSEPFDTQLVNVSRTGMFLATAHPPEIGTSVAFRFALDTGLVVLQGTAQVVRLGDGDEPGESGMGLRFTALDQDGRHLIDRIVEVGSTEPPPVPADTDGASGRRAVTYDHGCVRLVLSAATAAYFTYNPLLHIGVGGCFLPADRDVALGTGYQLDIVDGAGQLVLRCKAKVAAKQERRIGLRVIDVERDLLARLRGQIAKLSAPAP